MPCSSSYHPTEFMTSASGKVSLLETRVLKFECSEVHPTEIQPAVDKRTAVILHKFSLLKFSPLEFSLLKLSLVEFSLLKVSQLGFGILKSANWGPAY